MVSLKRVTWHHNLYLFRIVSEKIAVGDWNVDVGNSVLCIIHYLNFWHLQTISHINTFRILKGQHHDMPSLTRSQLYAPLAERVWTNPKPNQWRVERAVRLAGFLKTKFNRNLEWKSCVRVSSIANRREIQACTSFESNELVKILAPWFPDVTQPGHTSVGNS